MVMGWIEDFLLKTFTSTENTFLRVSFHNDGYPTPTPWPKALYNEG